jgi:bifunctional non-homologous end joining protein LigD
MAARAEWDGYRFSITIVDGFAHIWSRNGIPWTTKLARVAEALEQLGLHSAALDGELIAGLGRQADFGVLQKALSGKSKEPMTLVLFDLLHVDGVSIEAAPLSERKELLGDILANSTPGLAFSPHVMGDGQAAYALAVEREFEGIIPKRADLAPGLLGRSGRACASQFAGDLLLDGGQAFMTAPQP